MLRYVSLLPPIWVSIAILWRSSLSTRLPAPAYSLLTFIAIFGVALARYFLDSNHGHIWRSSACTASILPIWSASKTASNCSITSFCTELLHFYDAYAPPLLGWTVLPVHEEFLWNIVAAYLLLFKLSKERRLKHLWNLTLLFYQIQKLCVYWAILQHIYWKNRKHWLISCSFRSVYDLELCCLSVWKAWLKKILCPLYV